MKAILIGSTAFLLWSSVSTYYYVCQIKGLCTGNKMLVSELKIIAPKPITKVKESPKSVINKIESPGSYVLNHGYNHYDFIKNEKFNDYLDKVELYLSQNPKSKISVIGYTDNIASESSNIDLGVMRANFIKDYIHNHGIPESSISTLSEGELSPVSDNNTKAGRVKNRRTQIEIN